MLFERSIHSPILSYSIWWDWYDWLAITKKPYRLAKHFPIFTSSVSSKITATALVDGLKIVPASLYRSGLLLSYLQLHEPSIIACNCCIHECGLYLQSILILTCLLIENQSLSFYEREFLFCSPVIEFK